MKESELHIMNVWSDNLKEAMNLLSEQLEFYPFVSIDTEFPGVLSRPLGAFTTFQSKEFQKIKLNVDMLNLIQLGLTISNEKGQKPKICTFQFNFHFDLSKEMYRSKSIDLLKFSNLDFDKHKKEGILLEDFAFLTTSSGLLFDPAINFISFHSSSDFAYLLKAICSQPIPGTEEEFAEILKMNFMNVYDLKYLLRNTKYVKKGLQDICDEMNIKRIGIQHQAGSDSHLTSELFFHIKNNVINGEMNNDIEKCKGKLFGLDK